MTTKKNLQLKQFKKGSPIFLIGMMGSGKSTLGKKVADYIGYQFIDLDEKIETDMGVTIKTIFEIEGESGFRLREIRMLEGICQLNNSIIATGGGIITSKANREILKNKYCIYIKTSVEKIMLRTKFNKNRPLINSLNKEEKEKFIKQTLIEREPYYQEVATSTIFSQNNFNHSFNSLVGVIRQNLN